MLEKEREQRRQYFRLRYPKNARPILRVEHFMFYITESSEKGVKVIIGHHTSLYCGLHISATISLHGIDIDIEGMILRFDKNEVVIALSKGLSFKNMVSEQRYISQHFPHFFSSHKSPHQLSHIDV